MGITAMDAAFAELEKHQAGDAVFPVEKIKLVLALSTTNLIQTMKAEFISGKLDEKTRDAIAQEFLAESFRRQPLVDYKNMDDIDRGSAVVMRFVKELQGFWKEDVDPQGSGPGPRYYCVKEVLRRIGGPQNYDLHDQLFELMYLCHKNYIDFFKELLGED